MNGGAVVEHVELSIYVGRTTEFETAFEVGRRSIELASGLRWLRLVRQVENPSRYLLLGEWDSLEPHSVRFCGSAPFAAWCAAVAKLLRRPTCAGPLCVLVLDGPGT